VGPCVTTWIDDNRDKWTLEAFEVWEFGGLGVL